MMANRVVPTRAGVQYTPEQWALKRDIITQLYAIEGKSLREVKEHLRTRHDFRPTDRMYQRKLAQWGLEKKHKAPEMRAILRIARQRQAAGQHSVFRIRGRQIDIEEVVRYFKRRGEDPSTLALPECATPHTITIETPAPSPPPSLPQQTKPFGVIDNEDNPDETPYTPLDQRLIPYPTPETEYAFLWPSDSSSDSSIRSDSVVSTPVVYSDGQVTLQLIPDNPSLAMPIDPTPDFLCSRYVLYWTQQFLGHIVPPQFYSEDGTGQIILRPWRRPLSTWARAIGEGQELIRSGQEAEANKLRNRALASVRKHITNRSPITLLRYFEIICALCNSDQHFLDMTLRHVFNEAKKYLYVNHPITALTRLFLDQQARPFRGYLAQQGILRSLAILFETYKPYHPRMLYILDSQTQAHLDAQEYEAAVKSAKLYLERSESILGEHSFESCQAWHMLGDAHIKRNQLQEAATAYKRAFTLQQHLTLSKYRPATVVKKEQGIIGVRTQRGLADIAKRWGQYPQARQYLQVALHMARAAFGEDDVQVGLVQNDLDALDALNLEQMEEAFANHAWHRFPITNQRREPQLDTTLC
ncbi:hypothetical protein GJ744_002651 [Endocarpon pusillum]|uniref:Clr5 domain-containing protein n=1 Tax=Endocarpon pusillum TaxID=364733 RepID=A0A8H7E112_9EURO|nr:hypothetical protein GJ744_002651 [Endocarpon pusillum]